MINLKNKPIIRGSKVILRPFEAGDIECMEECLKDIEVLKFTGSSDNFDREFVVNWYSTRNEQIDRLDLAIEDKTNNVVVGEVVINEYDEVRHSMNFRILIGPRGRNLGLGTEATMLMRDYIFLNTDLKQLTLGVYAFNPRAQRVYEKAGFVLESVDKNELEFEGEMIDALNMILTREKWGKFLKL
ncbi:GNAT family protein [Clostridium sp. C8]|uniref:N-acetyltransferase domain-containing protein n=1 Tax=bioreactor metagenome TaxID=1076179 RepID=A0A644ZRT1_9ZZZZ|nr:GNAT family protein [Clostridium sp. C8]KLE15516.1 GCN5 family acetyltransferase [Clostridium sp. C8]